MQFNSLSNKVHLNFDDKLFKTYQFDKVVRSSTFASPLELHQTTSTIVCYGEKGAGKSTLLGTALDTHGLVQTTLNDFFTAKAEDEVHIQAYEVYLESMCDLLNLENSTNAETEATVVQVDSIEAANYQLRQVMLNRKQIAEEHSSSLSHLVVNLRTANTGVTFLDLVGFDSTFTQKIMNGESFSL